MAVLGNMAAGIDNLVAGIPSCHDVKRDLLLRNSKRGQFCQENGVGATWVRA